METDENSLHHIFDEQLHDGKKTLKERKINICEKENVNPKFHINNTLNLNNTPDNNQSDFYLQNMKYLNEMVLVLELHIDASYQITSHRSIQSLDTFYLHQNLQV